MTRAGGRSGVGATDLAHALDEARDQLHAMDEVLRALGRSASDLDHVMQTVTESARRLSHGDAALVLRAQ